MVIKHRRKSIFRGCSLLLSAALLTGCVEVGEDIKEQVVTEARAAEDNEAPHILSKEGITDLIKTTIDGTTNELINTVFNDSETLEVFTEFLAIDSNTLSNDALEQHLYSFVTSLTPLLEAGTQSESDDPLLFKVDYKWNTDGDTGTFKLNQAYLLDDKGGLVNTNKMGDLKNKEFSIRFLLIDTPELSKKQPLSTEAKQRTEELLSEAGSVIVSFDRGQRYDHYDRALMYIFLPDGRLLQEVLVREGLAKIAYVTEPNTLYLPQLEKAQRDAQNEKLGIWSI